MGKVRIKTFDETKDETQNLKKKARKEAKKAIRQAEKTQEIAEKEIKVAKATVEEKKKTDDPAEKSPEIKTETTEESSNSEEKTKKKKFVKEKIISARIKTNKKLVSKSHSYPLEKAIILLTKFKTSKFDESVELHVNVKEKGISGALKLPHGSGKTLRIKIADDALLASVEAGKIDFDILVATPEMMPKLAKIARTLGPKGLMPNPKNGTVSTNPNETVKKLSGGEIRYKTEAKFPIIHLLIGKMSFGEKKIMENAKTAIETVGEDKIKSVTLTSTMSPGIKLQLN